MQDDTKMNSVRRTLRLLLLAPIAVGACTPDARDLAAGEAAATSPLGTKLLDVATLRCESGTGVSAEWRAGKPALEKSKFGEDGQMIFDTIDRKGGTALLIGNVGTVEVKVISTDKALHFVEVSPAGNLNVTTVFATRPEGVGYDEFVYVMSRHQDIGLPGELAVLIPSQYHGKCRALR
jgi:hypothetical protein